MSEFYFQKARILYALKEDLFHDLKGYGLRISDFQCDWKVDEHARRTLEVKRELMDRSKFLREEITVLDRQVTKALANWRTRINNLRDNLESLDSEYMSGGIMKKVYLERIDGIANDIAVLRKESSRSFPSRAERDDL